MRFELPFLLLRLIFSVAIVVVFVVAIVSAFLLFPRRRTQLRNQPQAPDQNMILDGAFLIAQQTLIHFVVFALGLFAMRMMAG